MCKLSLIKKLLFVLALSFLCALPVFSQEDTSVLEELQMTALELSNSSNNSQDSTTNFMKSSNQTSSDANLSKDNLTESEMASMNPFELLDLLEQNLNKADLRLKEATQYSMNLEQDLLDTKIELNNSKTTLEELKKALLSNKDDTSTVIAELGLLYERVKRLNEEVALYTKMRQRLKTVSYIELGVGVPCLVLGLLPIWTDEQKNIQNLFLGIGSTATISGVFTFTFTITF